MAKDYSKTPVRLQPQIVRALMVTSSEYNEEAKALIARFKKWIEEHGLTFAVNQALRDLAQQAGLKVGEIETPTARMAKAQRRRWKAVEVQSREAEEKAEAKRELRRQKEQSKAIADESVRRGKQMADAPDNQDSQVEVIELI